MPVSSCPKPTGARHHPPAIRRPSDWSVSVCPQWEGVELTKLPRRAGSFAVFSGDGHAVATNHATSANHRSLVALGTASADQDIVPTLTYVATAGVAVTAVPRR